MNLPQLQKTYESFKESFDLIDEYKNNLIYDRTFYYLVEWKADSLGGISKGKKENTYLLLLLISFKSEGRKLLDQKIYSQF